MRIQFQILLFMVCLNVAVGMIIQLGLPPVTTNASTAGFQPTNTAGNITSYEQRFNATNMAMGWHATYISGIPIVGDIFSGLFLFLDAIRFLIDGFPSLLTWIGDTYFEEAGRTAFTYIANGFRAVYAFMMMVFVAEFISGRRMPD